MLPRIVIDTNVIIAALRSNSGASFRILTLVGTGKFDIAISVPLILEYEDVAKRFARSFGLLHRDIEDILDFLCQVGEQRKIHFLWRPFLKDSKDDMVLELAVESSCDYVVTFNLKDFIRADQFGIKIIQPGAFLRIIGEIS
jgi:putative PIN family toxin of toxin-antitoxin system